MVAQHAGFDRRRRQGVRAGWGAAEEGTGRMSGIPFPPIEGRTCGPCTACCEHLIVDEPELQKLPGVLCEHCIRDGGCGIYQTRPTICRTWYCGWRRFAWLEDAWRPDQSGIIVMFEENDIPNGYGSRIALKLELIGTSDALLNPSIATVLAMLFEHNIAVFLSIPGTAGYAGKKTLLNPILKDAVARRDQTAVSYCLLDILVSSALSPREKIVLSGSGSGRPA